jgi:hypothetical protein
MNAALALAAWLGAVATAPAPELQVEAVTSGGSAIPDLTDAVARALVASGARVVLRGPTSGPCLDCAAVTVVEAGAADCRIEIVQAEHVARATLHFPAGSSLFDRARAIAIQTRMLLEGDSGIEPKPAEPVLRTPPRRERKHIVPTAVAASEDEVTTPALEPSSARPPASVKSEPLAPPPSVQAVSPLPPAAGTSPNGAPGPSPSSLSSSDPSSAQPATVAETPRPSSPKPVAILTPTSPSTPSASHGWWPWVSTSLGAGAAIAAGVCALVARDRYDSLSDPSQSYPSALATKQSGEAWQKASFVLAGVAAVGIGAGVVGFWRRHAVNASATVIRGGGMVAVAGELP